MQFQRLFIFSLLFLCGCSSIPIKNGEFQRAADQGLPALETLCTQNRTGACALVGKPSSHRKDRLPILQGVTSPSTTRFTVLIEGSVEPHYFIRWAGGFKRVTAQKATRKHSSVSLDQINVEGLAPDQDYELIITSSSGELWDRRRFRTLNTASKRAKILLVSCLDDGLMEVGDRIWPEALAHKPDAVFMIGDNVYVDRKNGQIVSGDGDHIWSRYVETRARLPIFMAETLTPVFATWDDHDFGANDTDRTYPYKQDSAEVFFGFFPQRETAPGFERGPGVASVFTGFGLTWVFLDDRSFRSPNKSNSPDQTHLGPEQERWVRDRLLGAKNPVVLISGDQFFGGYHKMESFEGSHPENFSKLLDQWKEARVPLVFFSGDRHLTEIMKIPPEYLGYPTFEVTSSGIHAKVFPGTFAKNPNPRQWVGMDGINNYSVIETMRAEHNLLQFSVTAFALNHRLLYQKTLTVKHP